MKKGKKVCLIAALALVCTICLAGVGTLKHAAERRLVYEYGQTVTGRDVDGYTALFTQENRRAMQEYAEEFGETGFFREDTVEITEVNVLSADTGIRSAGLSPAELAGHEALRVCYAEMNVDGEVQYRAFVLAKEAGEWKILRVSVPDLRAVTEAGEGFGSEAESRQMAEQEAGKS